MIKNNPLLEQSKKLAIEIIGIHKYLQLSQKNLIFQNNYIEVELVLEQILRKLYMQQVGRIFLINVA